MQWHIFHQINMKNFITWNRKLGSCHTTAERWQQYKTTVAECVTIKLRNTKLLYSLLFCF